jgi:hypothetical protein
MRCSEAHVPFLFVHPLRLLAKLDDHLQILEGQRLRRPAPEVAASRLVNKIQENLPMRIFLQGYLYAMTVIDHGIMAGNISC